MTHRYRRATVTHTLMLLFSLPHTLTPTCSLSRPCFPFQLGYCSAVRLYSFYYHNTVPLLPLICSCLVKHAHTRAHTIFYFNMALSVLDDQKKGAFSANLAVRTRACREYLTAPSVCSSVCLCLFSRASLSSVLPPSSSSRHPRAANCLQVKCLPSFRCISCFSTRLHVGLIFYCSFRSRPSWYVTCAG